MLSKNIINKKGFTLIELLVVVAIISLLSSIVMASLNSARDKARFAQAIETMSSIEKAATLDYNDYSNYAPDVSLGSAPRFVPEYLKTWPIPPCVGWVYDWENWSGGATIRVSLRRADATSVFYYCIDPTTGNCNDGDGYDIKTTTNKILTCPSYGATM
jgi:prepilin-type N-terminal cleavage/methylation domain-containing protein